MATSSPYLESGEAVWGPVNKHVLYVEVLPSHTFNRLLDESFNCDQNTEDPLNVVTKCKKGKSKIVHRKKIRRKCTKKGGDLTENDKKQSNKRLSNPNLKNTTELSNIETRCQSEVDQDTLFNPKIDKTNLIKSVKKHRKPVKLKQNISNGIETKRKKVKIKQSKDNGTEHNLKLSNQILTNDFNDDCLSDDSEHLKYDLNNSETKCDAQNGGDATQNGPCVNTNSERSNLEGERCRKVSEKDDCILYSCNLSADCRFVASRLRQLNKHKKECHRNVKEFQCSECLYKGATASDLRKHSRQHSDELPYVCRVAQCNYKAKHNNSLVYHTKKYHPTGEPLQCPVESCAYSSHLPGSMRLHALIQHGPGKTLCCERCSYKCYLMGDLRKHQRVHSGDSPFQCSKCPYRCKISSNLKKHYRTHTMEQPFQCEHCEFRTNFVNSLKVHRRTHSNERPYSCTHCSYRCNHASNLKKHILRLHPGSIYSANLKTKRDI